jgi:hypothetical protein
MVHNSKKERLGAIEFGRRLIQSGDLDPLYIALYQAKLPKPLLCKWLLSYFCFYHAGLSCWVVSQKDYWEAMESVPLSGTAFPRGTERRHFRGSLALKAIRRLRDERPEPLEWVSWVEKAGPGVKPIIKRVKSLYGFGEWVSWKVPDICERLGLMDARFEDKDVALMFRSSIQGATEISNRYCPSDNPVMAGHRYLIRKLGTMLAPPDYKRVINVQETETICCKWHSHLGGHYPIGKDIIDIKHGLLRYKETPVARQLIKIVTQLEKGLS